MKRIKDPYIAGEMLPALIEFEARHLRNFCMNYRKVEGMPLEVDTRFFWDALIVRGYCGLIYHSDRIGFLACDGALPGVDRYYRPDKFKGVCAEIPNIRERKIYYTTDANIVKGDRKRLACVCYNTLSYRMPESMVDLIYNTAHLLAEIDLSMMTSTRNSRVCLLPIVESQDEAIRTSRTLQDIYDGKPASFVYRSGFKRDMNILPIKARDNIVTAELSDARRAVLSDFLRRLGVDNIAVDKKERTNLDEMSSNTQELNVNSNVYLRSLELFAQECRECFGLDLRFSIDSEIVNDFLESTEPTLEDMERGAENETTDSDDQ